MVTTPNDLKPYLKNILIFSRVSKLGLEHAQHSRSESRATLWFAATVFSVVVTCFLCFRGLSLSFEDEIFSLLGAEACLNSSSITKRESYVLLSVLFSFFDLKLISISSEERSLSTSAGINPGKFLLI